MDLWTDSYSATPRLLSFYDGKDGDPMNENRRTVSMRFIFKTYNSAV